MLPTRHRPYARFQLTNRHPGKTVPIRGTASPARTSYTKIPAVGAPDLGAARLTGRAIKCDAGAGALASAHPTGRRVQLPPRRSVDLRIGNRSIGYAILAHRVSYICRMTESLLMETYGTARRPGRPPAHPRPAGMTDATVQALGSLSAALEVSRSGSQNPDCHDDRTRMLERYGDPMTCEFADGRTVSGRRAHR